jgi:hypothetical protein
MDLGFDRFSDGVVLGGLWVFGSLGLWVFGSVGLWVFGFWGLLVVGNRFEV